MLDYRYNNDPTYRADQVDRALEILDRRVREEKAQFNHIRTTAGFKLYATMHAKIHGLDKPQTSDL